jgi:hypothetical protein
MYGKIKEYMLLKMNKRQKKTAKQINKTSEICETVTKALRFLSSES